jgi:serine protease Do
MNGQPIVMSADLPHLVGSLKDGEKAKLEIIRNGKRQNLDVTVGALPDEEADIGTGAEGSAERSSNRLGVSVPT